MRTILDDRPLWTFSIWLTILVTNGPPLTNFMNNVCVCIANPCSTIGRIWSGNTETVHAGNVILLMCCTIKVSHKTPPILTIDSFLLNRNEPKIAVNTLSTVPFDVHLFHLPVHYVVINMYKALHFRHREHVSPAGGFWWGLHTSRHTWRMECLAKLTANINRYIFRLDSNSILILRLSFLVSDGLELVATRKAMDFDQSMVA